MASRPLTAPFPVITNGDMSGNLTSAVSIISNSTLVSYSCRWSGTSPVGSMNVQVSNDYKQDGQGVVSNAGTWTDVPLSSTPSLSGNTGNGVIDLEGVPAYAIRLQYLFVSGVGTMQATVVTKVA